MGPAGPSGGAQGSVQQAEGMGAREDGERKRGGKHGEVVAERDEVSKRKCMDTEGCAEGGAWDRRRGKPKRSGQRTRESSAQAERQSGKRALKLEKRSDSRTNGR